MKLYTNAFVYKNYEKISGSDNSPTSPMIMANYHLKNKNTVIIQ